MSVYIIWTGNFSLLWHCASAFGNWDNILEKKFKCKIKIWSIGYFPVCWPELVVHGDVIFKSSVNYYLTPVSVILAKSANCARFWPGYAVVQDGPIMCTVSKKVAYLFRFFNLENANFARGRDTNMWVEMKIGWNCWKRKKKTQGYCISFWKCMVI